MNGIQQIPSDFRALILTSKCGGHEMVADSVERAIQEKFPNAAILKGRAGKKKELVADLLWPLGTSGADFYKKAVEGQWFRTMPIVAKIGLWIMKLRETWIRNALDQYIEDTNPNIIISVVPLINSPLLQAAASRGIPVMVIPTDSDNAIYSHNWPAPDVPLAPHRYLIPYSLQEIASRIHPHVDKTLVKPIGYGIRPEFYYEHTPKEKEALREKLQIPEGKESILLMLGGSFGSNANYNFVKEILKGQEGLSRHQAHYTVFCARQVSMQDKIKKLLRDNGFEERANGQFVHPKTQLSFSILGFVNNVHEYMATARCMFTKAGSGAFNEALLKKVPTIIDDTVGHMPWEGLNIDLTDRYGLGKRDTSFSRIPALIDEMMDPEKYGAYKDRLEVYHRDRPEQFKFKENIQHITQELLKEAAVAGPIPQPPPPKFLPTVKKIIVFVLKLVLFPLLAIKRFFTDIFPHYLVQYGLFSAFVRTSVAQNDFFRTLFPCGPSLEDRRGEIIRNGAKPIEQLISSTNTFLDAVRIPASVENPTKKTMIFVLAKHYQNLHPRNYDYLRQEGWDVVLFNPSEVTSKAMAGDLKRLMARIDEDTPGAKIVLNGYCVGAHVAAHVAVEQSTPEKPVGLIVDRGFKSANVMVQNFVPLAKLRPFARRIRADYNLNVRNESSQKMRTFTGKALFLAPPDGKDRLMHCKNQNQTRILHDFFPKANRQWHELPATWDEKKKKFVDATHWSGWGQATQDRVVAFLREFDDGISREHQFQTSSCATEAEAAAHHPLPSFVPAAV
ncbi:MAG: hypothetical protein JSS32_08635 [Verrucomicrobia bacterium]|nr:hypothetical protein [Verrucomicrobiota bacterium]